VADPERDSQRPIKDETRVKEKEDTKQEKRKKQKSEPATQKEVRIAGYGLVPIKLTSFPGERYLFYKEHINKGDDDENTTPSGRTLILVNIPVDITEETLTAIFSRFGKIESVVFKRLVPVLEQKANFIPNQSTGQRGIFAHLVFTSPKSLPKVLNFRWDSPVTLSEPEGLHGLEKWLESYKGTRPDPANVIAEVDAFMFEFDKQQEKARIEMEQNFGKPDQDGFILVQRGKGKLRDGKINITATKVTPELIEKSKKTAVLDDFYRFQRRENMRKQLADLRIRFEEDKKRIAKMRAQRRFRPG